MANMKFYEDPKNLVSGEQVNTSPGVQSTRPDNYSFYEDDNNLVQGVRDVSLNQGNDDSFKDKVNKLHASISGGSKALARGLGEGITLGFGDEIESGIRSYVKGTPYESERNIVRNEYNKTREQYPVIYTMADIMGAIAPALLLPGPGTAGSAARIGAKYGIPKIADSVAIGSIGGGVRGLGDSEATSSDNLVSDVSKGMTVGAIGGGLTAAAQPLGNLLSNTVAPTLSKTLEGIGAGFTNNTFTGKMTKPLVDMVNKSSLSKNDPDFGNRTLGRVVTGTGMGSYSPGIGHSLAYSDYMAKGAGNLLQKIPSSPASSLYGGQLTADALTNSAQPDLYNQAAKYTGLSDSPYFDTAYEVAQYTNPTPDRKDASDFAKGLESQNGRPVQSPIADEMKWQQEYYKNKVNPPIPQVQPVQQKQEVMSYEDGSTTPIDDKKPWNSKSWIMNIESPGLRDRLMVLKDSDPTRYSAYIYAMQSNPKYNKYFRIPEEK